MKNHSSEIKKSVSFSRYIPHLLLCFLIVCNSLFAFPVNDNVKYIPTDDEPLEVSVTIHISNIYDINTVNETYKIDGYLVYRWLDERMKFMLDSLKDDPQVYINDRARTFIEEQLWFPSCELINVQGSRSNTNIRVEVNSDGNIMYTERFFETFFSNMNFRSFPFDNQYFNIVMEPWGYNNRKVVLVNPQLFPKMKDSDHLIDKWQIDTMSVHSYEKIYDHIGSVDDDSNTWSRLKFEVRAQRMAGYFIWQVLLPLLFIIVASFVIFWIKDFSIQIGISFSLLLTVVAFNFYSASILPKLPYNTYIESVIILGYVFIFMGIIAVIINYRLNLSTKLLKNDHLLKFFRYMFPIVFLISMILLFYAFNSPV